MLLEYLHGPIKQRHIMVCPYEGSVVSAEAAALHPLQATTPIMLGATAGLRLLPEGKADKILAAVRKWLGQFAFNLDKKSGVSIVDGKLASHRGLPTGCLFKHCAGQPPGPLLGR